MRRLKCRAVNAVLSFFFIISIFLLQACSTSATMQIDVEVYKGPLSMEPAAQWAELKGLIQQAHQEVSSFTQDDNNKLYQELEKQIDNYKSDKTQQKVSTDNALRVWNGEDAYERPDQVAGFLDDCGTLHGLIREVQNPRSAMIDKIKRCITLQRLNATWTRTETELKSLIGGTDKKDSIEFCDEKANQVISKPTETGIAGAKACYRIVLSNAIDLAGQLRANAFTIAETHIGFTDEDRLIRGMQISMANFAAEYGNQIASRADALLKQMRGEHRHVMPTSIYLRDAGHTGFLNLFVWNHAGAPSFCEEGCGDLESVTRNRVKTVEHLFQNHNWHKINSVYASGMGDVSMAFVKDDIGNWNLKSFENDPSQLIDAYKKAGFAAVNTVAKLASTPSGLSKAKTLLSTANDIAIGRGGHEQLQQQNQTINKLKQHSLNRMEALKAQVNDRSSLLAEQIPEKKSAIDLKKGEKETLDNDIRELVDQRPAGDKEFLKKEVFENQIRADQTRERINDLEAKRIQLQENGEEVPTVLSNHIAELKADRDEYLQKKQDAENTLVKQEETDKKISGLDEKRQPLLADIAKLDIELKRLESEKQLLPEQTKQNLQAILKDYGSLVDTLIETSAEAKKTPVVTEAAPVQLPSTIGN